MKLFLSHSNKIFLKHRQQLLNSKFTVSENLFNMSNEKEVVKRLFGPLIRKVVEKDSKALNCFKNGKYLNQMTTKVNDELKKEISPLASLSFDVKKIPKIRIIPATPKKKSNPNKSVRIVEKLTRKELNEKLKFLSENLCASKFQ